MSIATIEINDAGVRFARDGEILDTSPGYAVLDGERLLVGQQGRANARLLPRWTNNRFWNQLGTEPMAQGTHTLRHHADLAFAHLESLWQANEAGVDGVVFAVPDFYSREQLGLLLGMAKECDIPVSGVVDTSVAAAATRPESATILHLDIFLHRTTLSVLKADTSLRRIETITVAETGLFTLWDRWANIIASQFIQSSRYDPLHEANSEQKLFDALPEWIEARAGARSTTFTIDAGSSRHEVAVSQEQLLQACSTLYPGIVKVIREHIPAGDTAALLVSDRFRGFPGLGDSLDLISNAAVAFLDETAVARGVRNNESAIVSGGGAISHTTSLPVGSDPAAAKSVPPAPSRPTHLLLGHEAHAIGKSIRIGGIEEGRLVTSAASPVCTVYTRGGETLVDTASAEVRVNGSAVDAARPLAPGDELSIGDTTLTLITVSG